MSGAHIHMSEVSERMILNVRVHGPGVFRLRMCFMLWLIRLAARVGGVQVQADSSP